MWNMYVPKRPCPRDLGIWYCNDCVAVQLMIESDLECPMGSYIKCGRKVGGRICGVTHLGYEWCEDCGKTGRGSHFHIGEYEVVHRFLHD